MSNFLYIDRKLVELDSDIAIPISYSVGDFKNPENRKRSVSKTITIPGSINNKRIFASAYNLSLTNTGDLLGFDFNPNVKVSARYIKNGVEIFNGLVRLLNVKVNKGAYSFEIVLFSDIVNMIKQMSDVNVGELDWSAYDHNLNLTNVTGSWGTPNGAGYFYPVIDFGYDNSIGGQSTLLTHKITNLVPYIYVKETFEKCFDNLGYSVDSDFFNEQMIKALVWGFGGGEKDQLTPVDKADREVDYTFDYNETIPIPSYLVQNVYFLNYFRKFNLRDFSNTLVTDNYLQFDSTSGKITCLRGGRYNLNLDLNTNFFYTFTSGSGSGNAIFSTEILKNGRKIGIAGGTNFNTSSTNYAINADTKLDLVAGDEITVQYSVSIQLRDANPFSVDLDIDLNNAFEVNLTSENGLLLENDTVALNRFIPELKCSEFVKGVINMFNLYVSEPDEDGVVKVEPLTNFYQGEENWTDLLDYSKEINIEPTVNTAPKTFKFKFAEDNDFQKQRYFDTFGENYGDYTFTSDNEYNTKEVVFQLPFAQTVPVQDNPFDYVIPSIIKKNNNNIDEPYKGKPRIFFNNGLQPVRGGWSIVTASGTNSYSTYPQAHHSYGNIKNMTFDLNFGKPKQVEYTFSHYRNNNLFSKYNRINIVEQTGADAKVLTAYFNLKNVNLDFSKLVNINGVLYRKNIVSDFDANGYETTKVELYKVIETTEINTSNPRVINTLPNSGRTPVIKSPNGVGQGTPILRGGKNSVLREEKKVLQFASFFGG